MVFAPRSQGGLGAPDISKYYYATHLTVIISWSSRFATSRWSELELSVTSPVHPCSMLWADLTTSLSQLRHIYLGPMLFTLSIWKKCNKGFSLSSPCPPLLNVIFNPEIPDSLSYNNMYPWSQAGIFQLRHPVHPVTRKLLSFQELQTKFDIPKKLLLSYLQFKHYFHSISPALTLEKPNAFEALSPRSIPTWSHFLYI